MTARIILEGISYDDFISGIKNIIREEIQEADKNKLVPISKKVACRKLGISFPTLQKIMTKENKDQLYTSDLEISN